MPAGELDRLREALADRYDLDREIGRGGMARVYLAYDRRHSRHVAIKVLAPELASLVGADRFLREIRIAGRLHHPHILPLYDSGSTESFLYYVMPYIEGDTLRARVRREAQLSLDHALRITREVADALAYAHGQGVIHRDVKPGNILLAGYPPPGGSQGEWHALVADFGIARAIDVAGEEPLTSSGIILGTPEYMSPEQACNDSTVDRRSDVYSLGCVLYEMLAGTPPFSGRTVQGVLARHRADPVPSLRVVRPGVPPAVEAAVERALAKVPADRYATVEEFAGALGETAGRRRSAARGAPRWLTGALAVLSVAAVGLFLALGPWDLFGGGPRPPAWILVADLTGPPGDPTLPAAVRELVTAELDQSRTIMPMPRQRIGAVMRDAGLADTAALTEERARELAVRSSVRAVLSGSVLPVSPGHYSIVLRVTEPDSGRNLLTVTGAADDRELIAQVQTAARAVRRGLGERRGAIEANKPLVQVATPSFPAYRKYVEAVDLSERGELATSNRVLQDALALDTGFASAWSTTGMNYLTMRKLDSAAVAFTQALRRPERLTDAQRYRVEAEAAYALRYDIEATVHWYDLLLQVAPRSIAAHNDRAVYLYSLGRYEEALEGFRQTEALEPFGLEQAQVEIFNQMATLLALGRDAEAATTARKLRDHFATYASLLLTTYRGDWAPAESLAQRHAGDPSTPSWMRIPAVTMLAAARAAQGAVASADRQLRAAAAGDPSSRAWFANATLLLASASGRAPGHPPAWLLADTTPGALVAGGLWAAMAGDTVAAGSRLAALERLPALRTRRLGQGPVLLRATIQAAEGRWAAAAGTLGPAAVVGERDGGDLDQVSGYALRWLMAEAYQRTARPDSAAAMYELLLQPTRVPFGHLALRGLVDSFARRRLALLYATLGRSDAAAARWMEFRSAFVVPDRDLRGLLAERDESSAVPP